MDSTDQSKLSNLPVWDKAIAFAVKICKDILPMLPADEKNALIDQLRRAAQSIPANIAEGFGRYHYQEAIQYCYIARGSIVESYSHLTFAYRMGYLTDQCFVQLHSDLTEIHRMLNGYITNLNKSKQGSSEYRPRSISEAASGYEITAEDSDEMLI